MAGGVRDVMEKKRALNEMNRLRTESGLAQRIEAFCRLGSFMRNAMEDSGFRAVAEKSEAKNPLFIASNIERAVRTWGMALQQDAMLGWLAPYLPDWPKKKKRIALVMAGNIPIVGFQDYLCALLCGYDLKVKLSSKDPFLLPFLHSKLTELASSDIPDVAFTTSVVKDFDAIIATGSGNTFRYFEYYFSPYPHLLRRNRTSCALLSGQENADELAGLADDALSYFGLGCRNVSKIYVPEGYDFAALLDALQPVSSALAEHSVYKDNYDYHKAIYMLNRQDFLDNGSVLLLPSTALASPMGVLYYETYQDKDRIGAVLSAREDEIQCVVEEGRIPFGQVQSPGLADYADGVDILDFLIHLPGEAGKPETTR